MFVCLRGCFQKKGLCFGSACKKDSSALGSLLGPPTCLFFSSVQEQRRFLLKAQDLVGYRVLLNLQGVHLRGFPAQAVNDVVPGFDRGASWGSDEACVETSQGLGVSNGSCTEVLYEPWSKFLTRG